MAITAAKLYVEVDANVSKAQAGLKTVEDGLRKLAGTSQGVGQIFAGVLGANLVSGAINGLRGLAAEGLQAFSNYERLGMSLQTLTARELINTGAAKNMAAAYAQAGPKAQELLAWTQKLAIESPFTQDDVAQTFRLAEAYGFTADEAKRLTQATIDFAAGSGASGDAMRQISLALGQIQAKGKIAGQEVLQLVNAGIAVDQILAKAFGKSTAEIVALREKGLIPADQAIEAIVSSLENDFGGAAKRQAGTFAGLVSSLQDIKQVGLREFLTGTFEEIQPYVQSFVDSFTNGTLQEKIRDVGNSFGEWTGDALVKMQSLTTWVGNLDDGTKKLILTFGALILLRGPLFGLFADLVTGVGSLVGLFPRLISVGYDFSNVLLGLRAGFTTLGAIQAAGLSTFVGLLVGVLPLMAPIAAGIWAMEAGHRALEKSVQQSSNAWGQFWQRMDSTDPMAIANRYISAQKAIQEEIQKTNWFFMLFSTNTAKETGNYSQLSSAILLTANSLTEYRSALEKAAAAQGLMIDANGNLVRAQTGNMSSTRVLVAENYALSDAQWQAFQAAMALSAQLEDYVDGPLRQAESQQKATAAATDKGTAALEEQAPAAELAAAAQEKFNQALKAGAEAALQAGLAGTLTKSMEEYKQSLTDLAPEQESLLARLQFLNVEGWEPSEKAIARMVEQIERENSTLSENEVLQRARELLLANHQAQIEQVNQALGQNATAQEAAAAAMRAATAEMIYQQAAAGLDAGSALTLARAMGVLSEQDYAVASTIQNLKLQYDAMDGTIDGVITNTGAFTAEVVGVKDAAIALAEAGLPITLENINAAMTGAFENADLAGALEAAADDPELQHTIEKEFAAAAEATKTTLDGIATDAQTTIDNTKAAFTNADLQATGATAGGDIVTGFKSGLGGGAPKAGAAGAAGGGLLAANSEAILAIKKLWKDAAWSGVGLAMVQGIAEGVTNNTSILTAAVKAAIAAALKAAQEAAAINSPSKLFADMVGKPIVEGMAYGILQAAPLPAAAVQSVVNTTAASYDQRTFNFSPVIASQVDAYALLDEIKGIIRSES